MTDKLSGIKAGDRVRVTFEGEVDYLDAGGLSVKVDGGSRLSPTYGLPDIQSPHFHIERIEKPLAVGDKVVPAMPSHCYGELLAISGTKAWVFWEHNRSHVTLELSDIVRCPEYR